LHNKTWVESALLVNLIHWFTSPDVPATVNKKNFVNVQIDAIGIGLASAAAPFLPVFLTRLGASNIQVSLLTTMPAITGFLLSVLIGRFLQTRRKIVPWFSAARLTVVLSYAFTGIITMILPRDQAVIGILAIWAIATLPQTIVAISFSVVMNAVAGPANRYELMTRRWSILGLTTSITVIIAGQILDRLGFPINYQLVFMGLSMGGLISFYFSSHIDLPDAEQTFINKSQSFFQSIAEYVSLIRHERPFMAFISKRFIFLTGSAMAAPIFPIYYVRVVHASDAWIGVISTAQSAVLIFGYFFWSRQSRTHGSRLVLLCTTFAISLFPAVVALTQHVFLIAIIAGISGIFQAGLDLVFFDELMKTIPVEYCATFVSIAQSLQYLSSTAAPIIGSLLADHIGLSGALIISAAIRLSGFFLFFSGGRNAQSKQLS
jgi:hypothetical protein